MRAARRVTVLAVVVAGGSVALAPAATFTPKTRTVKDAAGDVSANGMDLVRISLRALIASIRPEMDRVLAEPDAGQPPGEPIQATVIREDTRA